LKLERSSYQARDVAKSTCNDSQLLAGELRPKVPAPVPEIACEERLSGLLQHYARRAA
jgi:hypothetical protein